MKWWLAEWPQVYPNLIASAISSGPIWVWHQWRIKRLITEHLARENS